MKIIKMRLLTKMLIGFLAIAGAVFFASRFFEITFGNDNYWNHRGVFFLIFVTIFPRLTLLFSSVISGGFWWWAAWLFAPRFLVAVLATLAYWNQNPILVLISWMVAFGGESSEKMVMVRRSPRVFHRSRLRSPQGVVIDIEPEKSSRS